MVGCVDCCGLEVEFYEPCCRRGASTRLKKITLASVAFTHHETLGSTSQSETPPSDSRTFKSNTITDYPGHLVSKPEISLKLVGTLVINERGVSIEGVWGLFPSNEKFVLHSSNSETTLFDDPISFKGSFMWNKKKVVENGVELVLSRLLNYKHPNWGAWNEQTWSIRNFRGRRLK